MGDDDNRPQETRLAQRVATGVVSLVVAAAVAAFSLAWRLDRSVLDHENRLDTIESRQSDLRGQLRCDPLADPHPICARIDRLDLALKRYHKE